MLLENSMEADVFKRSQVVLALVLVAGLASLPVLAGPSAPMGIVTSAQHAIIGNVAAIDGTSIYDGDTFSTDATGALRVRFGASQMVLGSNSEVSFHRTEAG